MDNLTEKPELAPCIICGCNRWRKLYVVCSPERIYEDGFQVVKCAACGLVTVNPQPSSAQLSKFYEVGSLTGHRRKVSFGIEPVLQILMCLRVASVLRHKRTGQILDVGCGRGKFLTQMKLAGWSVFGVEPSKAATQARERGLDVFQGRLEDAHFPASSFDVVTLWHVFEHLTDPAAALEEISRILRDTGLLIMAVPNVDSLQARLGRDRWYQLEVPRHLFHYSEGTLKALLQVHGFAACEVHRVSLEYDPIDSIQTLLNMLGCEPNVLVYALQGTLAFIRKESALRRSLSLVVSGLVALLLGVPLTAASLFCSSLGMGSTLQVVAEKMCERSASRTS